MPAKKKVVAKTSAKAKVPVKKLSPVSKVKKPTVVKSVVAPKAKAPVKNPPPIQKVEELDSSIFSISAEQRFNLIQEESYLLAEQDGFSKDPGYYWHAAESKLEAEKRI